VLDPLVFALVCGSGRINRFTGGTLDDTESASLLDSGRRRPGGLAGAIPAVTGLPAATEDNVDDEDVFRA